MRATAVAILLAALALPLAAGAQPPAPPPPAAPPPGAPPPPAAPPPPGPYYAPPPGYPPPGYPPPMMPYGPPPGAETHDGFFLRLNLGGGYTGMATEVLGSDLKLGGGAGLFAVALGAAVAPNLIVYGEIFGDTAVDPTLEIEGTDFSTEDVSASVVGIGPGIAYYFMPTNLYLSLTLAASQIEVETPRSRGESDWGFATSAMIGKEWWASADWGLGISGQLVLGSIKDDDATWSVFALMLAFSATYN